MSRILVQFRNAPTLKLEIEDSEVGNNYFKLIEENYSHSPPVFRDPLKYTNKYMKELIVKAKKAFKWTWEFESPLWDLHTGFDDDIAPILHKSVETLVGYGFDDIPAKHDYLVHELHYCLHLVQNGIQSTRGSWLQIEWFNDEGFSLPLDFKFKNDLNIGDVKLQNPFVGHGPLQIFQEQDGVNITQTCKFHDMVKPGINIAQTNYGTFTQHNELLDFFLKHDPGFVELHGTEKILHYTGYPVVGKVTNLDDLHVVLNIKELEFDSLEFE
jgi:hypothetical protein